MNDVTDITSGGEVPTPEDGVAAHQQGVPFIALLPMFRFENTMFNGEPSVLVTIANQAIPNGVPFLFVRDLGLQFCSEFKKALQTGPQLAVAQSKLIVPGA